MELVLYIWNLFAKPGKPLFQTKVAANVCPEGCLNCLFNLTHPFVNISFQCCRRILETAGAQVQSFGSSVKLLTPFGDTHYDAVWVVT